ncbi:MAG: response regulator, partial [Victivallales bacterium]|nr:response regulator [Victivallales bacterium]
RLHIVKGSDDDHIALGFTDVDREYRDEQDKKRQMTQNLEIISGLATEYTALYYLNLDTGTFKVYSISDRLADTKKLIRGNSNFMEVYKCFVMNSVHPDDRETLLRVTNPQSIRDVLKDRKTYSVLFRRNYSGKYLWTEQIFVKFADKDKAASAIALGYVEKDREVRARLEHDARTRKQEEALRNIILSMDSGSEINSTLSSMLKTTAEYYGADRAFVFEADGAGQSFSNTHEWNADGIQSKQRSMQNIPNEMARPYLDKMDKSGICNINSLKDGTAKARHMLTAAGVSSVILAPITLDGAIVGFIGIDNPHDSTDDMVVLKTASTLIYGTIMRFKSEMLRRERDAQHDEVLVLQNMLHTARWSVKIGEDGHASSVEWSQDMRHALGFETDREFPDALDAWKNRVHPDDIERFLTAYYSAMNDRTDSTRFDMEHRIRNKDGNYRWFRAVCKFRRDETGRAISAIGVINDVSDVHELAKLQEKEKKYSDMAIALSESYESIYYVNLEDDTYLELNKKDGFRTLDLETTNSDFFGTIRQNLASSASAEDLDLVSSFMDKAHIVGAIANGETLSREYRLMDRGEQVHYRMKVARSRSNDKFIVVAVENVDDEVRERNVQQKQLEEALHMAQAANRAKTAFLNNMSHDIRTPMNAIIGFSGLAASHIDNKDQVLNYLQKIGQSSDHLLSLINEVLDMSRIESGKMNLNEKPESLAEILHTLRDIIHADINAKQLDLFIDTVDVTNERVVCDKLRLNQVLLNITSNAIKFTRPGGTIAIRIIQKAVLPSGYGSYEFHIKDNGIGMSEEYKKTIFEPFTRESTSTVSGIQGTGLGMAITKNIVDMMGGKIEVFTKKNEGTEFILTLEFKLADSTSSQPRKIPQLEGLRGLVVDDDSNTCLSVSRMLRDAGMRSEWCMSGKEAILRTAEALQIGDLYQVYIIDWIMPDMNGVETTRRIRKEVGDSVPIIILSAYDWSDIEDEAREAGVSGFVSKPLFPSDLQKVLAQFYSSDEQDVAEDDDKAEFVGRRVLLVEDNELNREIAQELLEENGFKVETAADGTFAVEMMKSASPGDFDLILMDVQMPVMNGYDATKAIRALGSEYCANSPIVAMTANAFAEDRQAALDAGMYVHIAKPI